MLELIVCAEPFLLISFRLVLLAETTMILMNVSFHCRCPSQCENDLLLRLPSAWGPCTSTSGSKPARATPCLRFCGPTSTPNLEARYGLGRLIVVRNEYDWRLRAQRHIGPYLWKLRMLHEGGCHADDTFLGAVG